MRPSSSPSDGLFGPLFSSAAVTAATDDRAWLQAMLDAEAALATVSARTGHIPTDAAEEIVAACRADAFYTRALGAAAVASGTPVLPLVDALAAALPETAARFVHAGATSQDILDSAAMLVARRALVPILDDLAGLAEACARHAREHRSTPLTGRTLLQRAAPTTFGLKAAGWLSAVDEARRALADERDRLAAQLGGPVGTLGGFDTAEVLGMFAAELGLAEPDVPWHTNRVRVAALASALGVASGVLGKIATDVVLLAQSEVAEVAEPDTPGRGASSSMPHKRNPVGSVLVVACAKRTPGLVATLLGALVQEHERATGAWHAEWQPLTDLLRLTGAAAERMREVCAGLRVDPERMRANLGADQPATGLAEHLVDRALAAHERRKYR